jgi:7-keto-8-aminopelargonate synthetase-like enzyme
MAGRAAIDTIPTNAHVFSAPACHPAIACGARSTGSFHNWAEETVSAIHQLPPDAPVYILSDSVNPLTVEVHDFSFLAQIRHRVTCIIDDSHGLGLLGGEGVGISHQLPRRPNIEYLITASLSKALHIPGGIVCCSNPARAGQLRGAAWYGTTTPPPPALLHVWLHHQPLYLHQLEILQQRIKQLHRLVAPQEGIATHPQLPILRLPPEMDEQYFKRFGMIISSFAYPDAQGPLLNRAVISALHTAEDIALLAAAIQQGTGARC